MIPASSDLTDSLLPHDRIASALEAAGVGVWEIDLTNRKVICSARCKQVFGFAPEQAVLYDHLLDVAHPADRPLLQQALDQALAPGHEGRFALTYRIRHSGTGERWVRSSGQVTADAAGRITSVQGLTRDVTESHLPRLAQLQQAQEFAFLAECVPEIIWMARPDGGVTYFNPRWMEYTGQTLAEAREWGWEPVIHPDDLALCLERWQTALTTGQPYEVEYRFRRHDGEYRWFIGRAQPLLNPAGSIEKWFGVSTDIHDTVLARQALQQREEDLEQAYQSLEAKVAFRTLALEQQLATLQARVHELEAQLRSTPGLPA